MEHHHVTAYKITSDKITLPHIHQDVTDFIETTGFSFIFYTDKSDAENLISNDSEDAIRQFLEDGLDAKDIREVFFGLHVSYNMLRHIAECELGWKPIQKKVYSWWLVTPYLFEQLKAHKEVILDLEDINMKIWGRTTKDQPLALDNVLQVIAGV